MSHNDLLDEVVTIARAAAEEVLEVYRSGCSVQQKEDGSPVTEADHRSQAIICSRLSKLVPELPIVAEEGRGCDEDSSAAGSFWLVDPLDGTKEFVSRNGEFTINIALIESEVPVLGVILAPALGRLFAATAGTAYVEDDAGRRDLAARATPVDGATVVSSRSHGDPEALAELIAGRTVQRSLTAGSSLKFCLVAAGEADLYPRFGRTMEWDTAAGDAILRIAGGQVTDLDGRPLRYGKPGFENPAFIARGLEGQ
ncbi:MAG TPA: 3'(2'),5'-bisphosphate nucleotidase CysQ [Solirubrobacteraceae bacterium]